MSTLIKNTQELYQLNQGDLVRVYYNLHKKTFSIQKKINSTWLVVGYKDQFMLADCKFKVSENGRQKVLRDRKKNVHAFIYGKIVESGMGLDGCEYKNLPAIISYNPYEGNTFVCKNLTDKPFKVGGAMCVKFTNGKTVSGAYLEKL